MAAEPPIVPPKKKSRWPRRFGILFFIVCPLLVVAGYLIENRRGAQAWETAKARLVAEGETLNLASLWPPPVPREENFCATLALDGLGREDEAAGNKLEQLRQLDFDGYNLSRKLGLPWARLGRDEVAWAAQRTQLEASPRLHIPADEPDAAKAIVEGFAPYQALFDELIQAAAERPRAEFRPPLFRRTDRTGAIYMGSAAPHPFSLLCSGIELYGRAELAVGNRDRAAGLLLALWRCREGVAADPWAALYASVTHTQEAGNLVMDGLRVRGWRDEDLARWQGELGKFGFPALALQTMRWDLADSVGFVEKCLADKPAAFAEWSGDEPGREERGDGVRRWLLRLSPRGWLRQHQVIVANHYLDHGILPLRDGGLEGWFEEENSRWKSSAGSYQRGPVLYRFMVSADLHYLHWMAASAAFAEVDRLQLLTACAIERFFLDHQRYPETLEELQPDFLPVIPLDLDGQPLRYSRDESNGRYRLWSVGLNLIDDWHGQPPAPVPAQERTSDPISRYPLDWVLSFPAVR